jgi:hypothetical protein
MDGVWLTLRVLALLALTGFLAVGLMFTLTPQTFTGKTVEEASTLWHSLSLAFMATVSTIAFMVAWKPRSFWPMLLPLALGKLTSSGASLYYYSVNGDYKLGGLIDTLLLNGVIDGLIGVIAVTLLIACWFSSRPS